jgi:hypothetical protein
LERWTAIVRGAVVVGIEKTDNTNFMKVKPCPRNYGLNLAREYSLVENDKKDLKFDPVTNQPLAVNQMRWLFRRGDAILSNQIRKEEQTFVVRVTEPSNRSGKIPIYTYSGLDIPTRFKNGMYPRMS